jgi:CheY-like chemotaxis protein/transcriptional regulator with XRE-family HTH domain
MSANRSSLASLYFLSERRRSGRTRARRTKQFPESTSLTHELETPNKIVLVVDDDPTIRSTLAEALRNWGYQSREAATLAEARTLVTREIPAAVLLDVKMPDGSGISILDELKTRSPETVVIIMTGFVNPESAFEAGLRQAHGFLTKPFDQTKVRTMLEEALAGIRVAKSRQEDSIATRVPPTQYAQETKPGRPQHQTTAPLGQVILKTMKLLGLSYKDIAAESERLARLHNNPDMRIGRSTLGNIISGKIRQPGTAKLDALRIILNLSRIEIDAALGLQPERRFAKQLELTRARTHEVSLETVTRNRKIKIPILRDDANLEKSQLLDAAIKGWTTIEVEYLSLFYPPHYCYVVVGEGDNNASPVAPPGSRLLVNKLLNRIRSAETLSYHERELYYVMTPHSFTCAYLETAPGDKIVLLPHPHSGNIREEFKRSEINVIGQVIGVLYPR